MLSSAEQEAVQLEVTERLRQGVRAAALACPVLTSVVWISEIASQSYAPLPVQLGRAASIVAGLLVWRLTQTGGARKVFVSSLVLSTLFMVYPCYVLSTTGGAESRDFAMIPIVFLFAPFVLPLPARLVVVVQTMYLLAIAVAIHAGSADAVSVAVLGKAYKTMVLVYVFSLVVGVRNFRTLRANVLLRRQLADEARSAALGRERERMARDLHDKVGAGLTGIAQRAEREMQRDDDRRVSWAWCQDMASICLQELRDAIWSLSEQRHDFTELLSVLRRRTEDACQAAGIAVEWEVEGNATQLGLRPELATGLSSVFREAIANATRHSGTPWLGVRIQVTEQVLRCTISDRGRGLGAENKEGRGLTNIRTRVRQLGGEATIAQRPEGGVVVSVHIPSA